MNKTFKLTGVLAAVGAIVTGGACLLGKYLLGKANSTVISDEEANNVHDDFGTNSVETYTDVPAEEEQEPEAPAEEG